MSVHVFLARSFDTTHENEFFDIFLKRIEARWGQTDEDVVVIGNPIWNGATPDTVVVRQKAITIIDFKNFGGCIEVTENGPWMCKGTPVKGGSKSNPLVQVTDNKRLLKDWFEELPHEGRQNFWRGIFGMVVFHKPVELKGHMAPMTDRWFRIADLDRAVETLGYFSANDLCLSRTTLLEIPERLGVRPYTPSGSLVSIECLGGSGANAITGDARMMTQSQTETIASLQHFLSDNSKSVFRVLGMTSTGKSYLVPEIERLILNKGRQIICLAPNNRLAALLSASAACSFKGIYTHLYTSSTHEDEQDQGDDKAKEKKKRKVLVHRLHPSEDADNCVYVIDEAHLISNAYFEREGERYGSGRLWEDFLKFAGLPESGRKIILIGDPYQLSRGGVSDMPIHNEILAHRGLSDDAIELERVIIKEERSLLIRNAKALVQAIRDRMFNHLDLVFDDEKFVCPPKGQNLELALTRFRVEPRSHVVLVFSNKEASQLNTRIRQILLETNGDLLVNGDRIEIYSPIQSSNPLEEAGYYYSGMLATIDESSSLITSMQQALSGREQPINWRVGEISLTLDFDQVTFNNVRYLVDFLEAEKPELDSNLLIALKVKYGNKDNKSQSGIARDPLARLRYAYATTCHHAQGVTRPCVFINTETGQGRCSEEYFRWIYTAITRAEREVILLNFKPLTPLTDARWTESGLKIVTDLKCAVTLKIDPDAIPSQEDLSRELPSWSVKEPNRTQLIFWLEISKCLEQEGWSVSRVSSHPYQEQYDLVGPDSASCSITLSYNQAKQITAIRSARGTDASIPLGILGKQVSRIVLSDARGLMALREVQRRFDNFGWIIEEVKESKFLLTMRVSKAGAEKVKLDLHFNGDGMVSTLRPTEAVSKETVIQLRNILIDSEEATHV